MKNRDRLDIGTEKAAFKKKTSRRASTAVVLDRFQVCKQNKHKCRCNSCWTELQVPGSCSGRRLPLRCDKSLSNQAIYAMFRRPREACFDQAKRNLPLAEPHIATVVPFRDDNQHREAFPKGYNRVMAMVGRAKPGAIHLVGPNVATAFFAVNLHMDSYPQGHGAGFYKQRHYCLSDRTSMLVHNDEQRISPRCPHATI